jgi:hypothetical protein
MKITAHNSTYPKGGVSFSKGSFDRSLWIHFRRNIRVKKYLAEDV